MSHFGEYMVTHSVTYSTSGSAEKMLFDLYCVDFFLFNYNYFSFYFIAHRTICQLLFAIEHPVPIPDHVKFQRAL